MTISNGSTIDKADLDALLPTGMSHLQDYKNRIPRGYNITLSFVNVLNVTPQANRTKKFVVPRDCYIETVSVVLVALSAAATVDITGNGLLYSFPISISGSGGPGQSRLPRILYDNVENVTQDRRFRLINQGSTVTVTVDSTKTSGASSIEVSILMRQFLGR